MLYGFLGFHICFLHGTSPTEHFKLSCVFASPPPSRGSTAFFSLAVLKFRPRWKTFMLARVLWHSASKNRSELQGRWTGQRGGTLYPKPAVRPNTLDLLFNIPCPDTSPLEKVFSRFRLRLCEESAFNFQIMAVVSTMAKFPSGCSSFQNSVLTDDHHPSTGSRSRRFK